MTKYKAFDSTANRKIRRVVEHNKKMITKHFHLDYNKHQKEHTKRLGEYYRSITAKFTDKEMEEAEQIGRFIIDRIKPEDGVSHKGLAYCLWGEKCLEDDTYVSKIDRLLYVLQMIVLEFMFDTTMETEEQEAGGRIIPIIPHVKSTKKIRVKGDDGNYFYKEYEKPFEMIFNAAASREYGLEAIEKSGQLRKLKRDDFARVGLPRPLSKEDRVIETMLDNFKGVGNRDIDEYVQELGPVIERMMDVVSNFGPDGMWEDDLIHEVIPESRGKSDDDLEPYRLKFHDAMYMFYTAQASGARKHKNEYKKACIKGYESFYQKAIAEWKRDNGYLEGK